MAPELKFLPIHIETKHVYDASLFYRVMTLIESLGLRELSKRMGNERDPRFDTNEVAISEDLSKEVRYHLSYQYFQLLCPRKIAFAQAVQRDRKFIILPGARLADDVKRTIGALVEPRRRYMLDSGIARKEKGRIQTVHEYPVRNKSLAAKIVSGYSDSGNLWKPISLNI